MSRRWDSSELRTRPRDFDAAVADEILLRVGSGEMLTDICRQDPDMPLPGVFLEWCEEDQRLDARYLSARRRGAELMVDSAVSEASSGNPSTAGARSRAAMWHAERTWPDRYGPRATLSLPPANPDTGGGVDYRADVRRRLEQLHDRQAAAQEAAAEADGGESA